MMAKMVMIPYLELLKMLADTSILSMKADGREIDEEDERVISDVVETILNTHLPDDS